MPGSCICFFIAQATYLSGWLLTCLAFSLAATDMAMLEAAIERLNASKMRDTRSKPLRLLADPCISFRDVLKTLVDYSRFKQSPDVWSLLAPPPGCPQKFNFKSCPCGDWLLKTSGLLFEVLHVCPNTKLLSKTVVQALHMMIDQKL